MKIITPILDYVMKIILSTYEFLKRFHESKKLKAGRSKVTVSPDTKSETIQISKKHLQRYVDEITYRLNKGNCKVHTIDRGT